MRALNRQRDALGHPATIDPLSISLPDLDPLPITYLDGYPRGKVMDWELGSDLEITIDGTARLRSRTAGRLAVLTRPTEEQFKAQLDLISVAGDQRADRYDEIEVQLSDQLSFFGATAYLHPSRTPRTIEFIEAAHRLCVMVQFRIKHAFACPRPIRYSTAIQPVIQTPTHGSLPSGHATEAFMFATLLREMFHDAFDGMVDASDDTDPFCETIDDIAARIAVNRTVAGVHFPLDSAAGSVLGRRVAQYVMRRAGVAPKVKSLAEFNPADWQKDFDSKEERENRANASAPTEAIPESAIIKHCWEACKAELAIAFPGAQPRTP